MKESAPNSKSADLQKTQQALLRASEKARLLAAQTGTPFIVRPSAQVPTATNKQK
ncbi:MAG: hypothetical protein ABL902_03645 [Gallionella sp.]